MNKNNDSREKLEDQNTILALIIVAFVYFIAWGCYERHPRHFNEPLIEDRRP